jgi:hypothetical protein
MKTEHPALEADLEKALREDTDGSYLEELQRSLRAYIAAVEIHMRGGLEAEQYVQWRDLQKATEAASLAAEEVRQRMREE